MGNEGLARGDRFGILRPLVDAHSLGIGMVKDLLENCGVTVAIAGHEPRHALGDLPADHAGREILRWIRGERLTSLGFSYRLDPEEGLRSFALVVELMRAAGLYPEPIRSLWFAGLPDACRSVKERFPFVAGVFLGDESPSETLEIFGLRGVGFGDRFHAELGYDEDRLDFGRQLVAKGDYLGVKPVDRSASPKFGRRGDGLASRVSHGSVEGLPPLMRAHVGPWLPDRREALSLFLDWTRTLAKGGLLDVLSIGSSQLSQEAFGEDWTGRPDGGGVPVNSPEEFEEIWRAARPMLVRSYAGTKDVPRMAAMLQERIDIAWHALSLWWFSRLDGRGPHGVLDNLREHFAALRYIASTGKPFEPNVPHHFAFRGADDVSYVVSGLLAARTAKTLGIQRLVLQVMLNTPRYTWGICDLAKARALLHLVRELEDGDFRVYLQPRGGLDYFSHDETKAKAQLAAVTALMDDIEPRDERSPEIIHVVSYSEGSRLADPSVVEESIRLTRHALSEYRRIKREGSFPEIGSNPLVLARTAELIAGARATIGAIESTIPHPYTPEGLYRILSAGFLPLPWLAELRDEFPEAVRWNTKFVDGGVATVDDDGAPLAVETRLGTVLEGLRRRESRGGENGRA